MIIKAVLVVVATLVLVSVGLYCAAVLRQIYNDERRRQRVGDPSP
jgi:hypothetical protein